MNDEPSAANNEPADNEPADNEPAAPETAMTALVADAFGLGMASD